MDRLSSTFSALADPTRRRIFERLADDLAWQAQAAEVLQRDAGIASETTALILERAARGEEAIPAGAVVVCDEASTMPTRALERLAHVVAWRADGLMGEADDLAARRHWHTHCWRIRP